MTTAAARNRTRATPAVREDVRTPNSEARPHIDADGNPIIRVKRGSDRYAIPDHVLADAHDRGMVLQWNCVSVLNMEDKGLEADIYNAGWRPVSTERYAGVFLPPGSKGTIVLGGLRLDERPLEIHMEAKAEETHAALAQVRGSREQFGMQGKTQFDTRGQAAGFNGVRVSTVHHGDATPPKHELAID